MLAARLARFPKIKEHAWCPVYALARFERCADQSERARVLHHSRRLRSLQPLVEPTGRDAEFATRDLSGALLPMSLDELVLPPNAICSGLRCHGCFLSWRRLTLAPSTKVW